MRTLNTEFKRLFFEKKMIWLLVVTVLYVTLCSLFWNLQFKLDYGYSEIYYKISAFKLWQDTMSESFMVVLMQIIPSMVWVLSFMDDRKNGVDQQICLRSHSNIYYTAKYITVIAGGILYNFLSVILIYLPLYSLLSTGDMGWNYLDRSAAVVGRFFNGNTAVEFVLIIAVCYAFVGGVCAAMSYVLSMWIDNKMLVCILPYIIFRILRQVVGQRTILTNIILGDVDTGLYDKPFIYSVYYFVWWILLLSILFVFSYTIRIEDKK